MEGNLEKELMTNLRELTDNEQDSIKVFSSMHVSSYEKIKNEKIESLNKRIIGQIEFYGRKKNEFLSDIEILTNKYSEAIDKIIGEYNTWFCAVLNKLQESYNNQKIAMTNTKLSIDSNNEVKKAASEYKINNYEIVIQECKSQLKDCKENLENKLNEMFYSRDKSLSIRKNNIFQKIMNIFCGKSKVNNFVINSLNKELDELNKKVDNECERINAETINKIAIIEDAIFQTQTIFKNMLKEYGYYE